MKAAARHQSGRRHRNAGRPAATTPNSATNTCVAGYFGGTPFFGRDINGDGDMLDAVTVLAPSQTQTHRYGVIAGLRWDINDDHTVRVSYTLDHAHHRQTGEVGLLDSNGEPVDVFPVNDPEADGIGVNLQKRDRQSYAILNQVSGEYRGEFFDDRLTRQRRPARCRSSTASSNNYLLHHRQRVGLRRMLRPGNAAVDALLRPAIPMRQPETGVITGFAPPQKRKFKYDKLLPNIGVVYDITPRISAFANYAKGLSVPSTDNLYNSLLLPRRTQAKPEPETTDSFDVGLRYRSRKIQAQVSASGTPSSRTARRQPSIRN